MGKDDSDDSDGSWSVMVGMGVNDESVCGSHHYFAQILGHMLILAIP